MCCLRANSLEDITKTIHRLIRPHLCEASTPVSLEQLTKPLLDLREGRRPSSAWSRVKLKG
jgi:hypothetical protein